VQKVRKTAWKRENYLAEISEKYFRRNRLVRRDLRKYLLPSFVQISIARRRVWCPCNYCGANHPKVDNSKTDNPKTDNSWSDKIDTQAYEDHGDYRQSCKIVYLSVSPEKISKKISRNLDEKKTKFRTFFEKLKRNLVKI